MAALKTLPAEFVRMEDRLVAAIENNKIKPWPIVSALAGVVMVALALFAVIYGGR